MKLQKDKLIDYNVLNESGTELGTADITLPSLEYLSETMKGVGMSGEADILALGQIGKLPLTINWNTINGEQVDLFKPKAHLLVFYNAQQNYDAVDGDIEVQQVKVTVKALPKKMDLGKLDKSSKVGSSNEMEAVYIKVDIDGENKIEFDRFGYKCVVGGYDYLAAVRTALAMD